MPRKAKGKIEQMFVGCIDFMKVGELMTDFENRKSEYICFEMEIQIK